MGRFAVGRNECVVLFARSCDRFQVDDGGHRAGGVELGELGVGGWIGFEDACHRAGVGDASYSDGVASYRREGQVG
jgi:hypothetical protein